MNGAKCFNLTSKNIAFANSILSLKEQTDLNKQVTWAKHLIKHWLLISTFHSSSIVLCLSEYKDILSVHVAIQSTVLTNFGWWISSNCRIAKHVKNTVSQCKYFWYIWVSVPECCTFVSIIFRSSFITVRQLYCPSSCLFLCIQFFLFVC